MNIFKLIKSGSRAHAQWANAAGHATVRAAAGTAEEAGMLSKTLGWMGRHKYTTALLTIGGTKVLTGQGAVESAKQIGSWLLLDSKNNTGELGKDIAHQVGDTIAGEGGAEKVDDIFSGLKNFITNPAEGLGSVFKNMFGGLGNMLGGIFGGNGGNLLSIGALIPALFLTFGRYGFLGKVFGILLGAFAFSNMFKGTMLSSVTQAVGIGRDNPVQSAQDIVNDPKKQKEISDAAAQNFDILAQEEFEGETVKSRI